MTSLVEIYRRFPTKEAALAHLEKVRWPDGPHCPQCGADTVARKAEVGQRDRLQCWSCERSFSPSVGTIFHNSHVDLQRLSLPVDAEVAETNAKLALVLRVIDALASAFVSGKPRKRNRRGCLQQSNAELRQARRESCEGNLVGEPAAAHRSVRSVTFPRRF